MFKSEMIRSKRLNTKDECFPLGHLMLTTKEENIENKAYQENIYNNSEHLDAWLTVVSNCTAWGLETIAGTMLSRCIENGLECDIRPARKQTQTHEHNNAPMQGIYQCLTCINAYSHNIYIQSLLRYIQPVTLSQIMLHVMRELYTGRISNMGPISSMAPTSTLVGFSMNLIVHRRSPSKHHQHQVSAVEITHHAMSSVAFSAKPGGCLVSHKCQLLWCWVVISYFLTHLTIISNETFVTVKYVTVNNFIS